MPLPRATAWARDPQMRRLTIDLLVAIGFGENRVETALFRYERGFSARDEFETDAFVVFTHMNNLHSKEASTNGGVKEGN